MADFTGTAGNDTIIGTSAADRMEGLSGNDTYHVNHVNDLVIEAVGGGSDTLIANVSYTLRAGEEIELARTAGSATTSSVNLTGNDFANALAGNAAANVLDGKGGADAMYGYAGNDTYYVDHAGDSVIEGAGAGSDRVTTNTSYVLRAGQHVELLTTYGSATTAAINLTGNELANTIVGNAAANTIDGKAGADAMYGYAGNDIYYVDHVSDSVVEAAGAGSDWVNTNTSYVLRAGQHVELLTTYGSATTNAINLTGNELANTIVGNAAANTIDGKGGADAMYGYAGNDIYYVDHNGDRVLEAAGGGSDTVYANASFALSAGQHVELLTTYGSATTNAINLTGNELANTIVGNAAANTIDGKAGADAMYGYAGNDIYYVDQVSDSVFEAAGGGSDIVFANASFALAAGQHVEQLTTFGSATTNAINLTGNELANTIVGNAAANTIDGKAGADAMYGYAGNDTYHVDHVSDSVVEAAGGGSDTVTANVSYTLGAGQEVELLRTAGSATINLTGNELANTLVGNAGANVLEGRGGADSFAFTTALSAGNVDTITDFTPGVDKIILAGGQGDPFASLATGALGTGSFLSGTTDPYAGAGVPPPGSWQMVGMDSNDYILYHIPTGALLYDADGNGPGAAVRFATLQPGLSLTAADFIVSGPANNAPSVTSGASASIAENSPATTIVYQALATDADGDRITYSLAGTDAALLTIDAVTGAVRLNSAPDFETKASYSFNVVASDSGTSTPKAVTLTITDVLDTGTTIISETSSPNDSTGAAQSIDRGTFRVASNPNLPDPSLPSATIVGNLPDAADEDFFSITLEAGEKLILDVDNSGGNLDSHVHVFNAAGVEIGDNDDPGGLDPGSAPHDYGHNTDSLFSFRAPTSGTYYFSIESFQDPDPDNHTFGSYELHVSIGPPAAQAQIIEEDIQALISGSQWPTPNLTYAFPNAAGDYPPNPGESQFGDDEPASFQAFSGAQPAAVQQMVQHISNVTLLTFQQLTDPSDGDAMLRFAMTDATDAAHAYYPGDSIEAGSTWFNKQDFFNPQKGNYAWMGILHETGHALGLKHGHEAPAISADRDSLEYTVMTYRSFPGHDVDDEGGYSNETWGYPQSLMMYDIAALQRIYGANFNFNSGNSVYSWSPTTGEMSINGIGQGAPGENRIFMTIWDGNGVDTYDFSNYGSNLVVNLSPGEWTNTSAVQRANLGTVYARGNIANALLFDDDPRSLIENAVGGTGNDTLIANQAANRFTGGAGADVFRWDSAADLGLGSKVDTIADFLGGTDKIDLVRIDGQISTAGDDGFDFIGTAAFSAPAGPFGQLRYDVVGADVRLQGDWNGDLVADFEILFQNIGSLAYADFLG